MQKSLADSFYWASRPENGISGWFFELLGRLFEAFSPGVQDDSARVRFERLREVGGDGLIAGGGSFKDFMRAAMNMDPAAVRQIIKSDPALREKLEKLGGSDAIEVMLRELGPDGGSFKGYLKSLIETAGPQRVKDLLTGNPDMVKMAKELAGFEGTDEDLKAFVDREIDKLGEEVEAVKGMINGPLDASVVVRKFRDFVADTKAKVAGAPGMHAMATQERGDQAERDRKDRDNHRTLTWLLANNPAYAQAHADAVKSWRDTEDAAEQALRAIEAALEQARIEQHALMERAPLINGKRVFRDEDGSVWTQDDIRLPDDIANGIQWQGNEPTRKEFKAGQARIEDLIRSGDRVRGIQVEVADLGAELNDEENPPSQERTEEIVEEFKTYRQEIKELLPSVRVVTNEPTPDRVSAIADVAIRPL